MQTVTTFFSQLSVMGLDVPLIALLIYILTNILKKFVPSNHNNVIVLMPFALGVISYFFYSKFLICSFSFDDLFNKGLRIGGIATLYYAIVKQLFSSKANVSKIIGNILKGIVSPNSIEKTTKNILKELNFGQDNELSSQAIYNIIAGNASISEAECNALTSIVIKAFEETKTKK